LIAPGHSVFCTAARTSGLLAQEQLEQVLAAVRAMGGDSEITDDQIAAVAVEQGLLNRWQAEQLLQGRTKFTLGQYQILDSLGQGGMGHVFKAEHSMLGRLEAVKVLPISKMTPETIASFRREIRAHAQLNHPNLVRLSYAGQDGSTYFFVTEFVPGSDLRKLVRKKGRLNLYEAATIISQAAQGLKHAHENGLVHRDVKPGNLLVTPDGHTKVADLGLAGYHDDELNGEDPRAGRIVGTADYLAPETIRNPGEVSPVSDIYSLGCTLYYAVTGKVLFPGGTTRDKLRRHCEEMPITPLRFNADLDEAFLDVLAGMLEKEPAKRIPTADEVIRRLAPWTLQAVPISVHEAGVSDVPNGSQFSSSSLDGVVQPPPFVPPTRFADSGTSSSTESQLHETLPLEEELTGSPWYRPLSWQLRIVRSKFGHLVHQMRTSPELRGEMLALILLAAAVLILVVLAAAIFFSR